MKEYPLTLNELYQLGGLSFAATLAYSVSGFCLGKALDLETALSLSNAAKPTVVAMWKGVEDSMWAGVVISGLFGTLLLALDGLTLRNIIKETEHDDD